MSKKSDTDSQNFLVIVAAAAVIIISMTVIMLNSQNPVNIGSKAAGYTETR